MFIILGILLWLIIGFCTYIWCIKLTNTTYFSWGEFLVVTCCGLLSFIIMFIVWIFGNFNDFMESLIKKINK